jgi:hypothetical protein
MASRQALSAVTLAALVGLLVVGAFVGWRTLTAPVPEGADTTQAAGPGCDDGVARGDVIRPPDVTVSVYNAGTRAGLAGQTMSQLEARGFIPADVGNAPEDLQDVDFVRVLAPSKEDPAARLVALQFGQNTLVEPVEENLGPGVEVVVGDRFVGLVKAPLKLRARVSGSGC